MPEFLLSRFEDQEFLHELEPPPTPGRFLIRKKIGRFLIPTSSDGLTDWDPMVNHHGKTTPPFKGVNQIYLVAHDSY